jgi:predicted PurR-regulated permease PerM
MPRPLAAFLSVLGATIMIVLVLAALAAPFVAEIAAFVQDVPTREEIQGGVAGLNQYIATLPEPVQAAVRDSVTQTLGNARQFLQDLLISLPQIGFGAVLGLVNAVGVVLGLLVIPSWILMVVRDQPAGVRAARRALPAWLGPDLFAAVRIVDQSLGVFLRGLLVQALAVGALTYGGLRSVEVAGFDRVLYPLPLATLAAVMNLVPVVGPIASGLIAVLVGLINSPTTALAILVVYIIVQQLAGRLVGSRIEGRLVSIHPGVLAVVAVVLSQLGLAWALLTIPIVAIARDLFQYAYGRMGDPPTPAGVLPGERPPASDAPRVEPAPMVYRRAQALRAGDGRRIQ